MSVDIRISITESGEGSQDFLWQKEEGVPNQRAEYVFDVLVSRAREKLFGIAGHNQIKVSVMTCRNTDEHVAHRWNADYMFYGPYWCNGATS